MYLHFNIISNVNKLTVVNFNGFEDNINYSWFLVNDQRDTQISFYVFISIYNSLHVSSTQCSSEEETNCINTTSGNCQSVLVAVSCAGWD
jgi:hypothetical protein